MLTHHDNCHVPGITVTEQQQAAICIAFRWLSGSQEMFQGG